MSSTEKQNTANSFGRRTWDEAEYAQRAFERRQAKRDKFNEDKAKSQGDMKASKFFQERQKYIDQIDQLNKISFVSDVNSKDTGFYCELCRRKFKDNLKYIDHLNSTEHFNNSGFDMNEFVNKAVTIEEVDERLEYLSDLINKRKLANGEENKWIDLNQRIQERKAYEEKQREKRREKRKNKRQKRISVNDGGTSTHTTDAIDVNSMNNQDGEMSNLMGFSSFR